MKKLKLVFPKTVRILATDFRVVLDKDSGGGWFNMATETITIGTKYAKTSPIYTLSVISHELMEVILVLLGGRFANGRTGENYLFNFEHQVYENAIQIHTEAILNFIG